MRPFGFRSVTICSAMPRPRPGPAGRCAGTSPGWRGGGPLAWLAARACFIPVWALGCPMPGVYPAAMTLPASISIRVCPSAGVRKGAVAQAGRRGQREAVHTRYSRCPAGNGRRSLGSIPACLAGRPRRALCHAEAAAQRSAVPQPRIAGAARHAARGRKAAAWTLTSPLPGSVRPCRGNDVMEDVGIFAKVQGDSP